MTTIKNLEEMLKQRKDVAMKVLIDAHKNHKEDIDYIRHCADQHKIKCMQYLDYMKMYVLPNK